MDIKTLQKYKSKSVSQLLRMATKCFNLYIRNRDMSQPCISCGRYSQLQAGHFYSAGHYPILRYNENNVHGQCLRCNYYLSGDLSNYRMNLLKKIGEIEVMDLDRLAAQGKKINHKWDRFTLIEIIEKYKKL